MLVLVMFVLVPGYHLFILILNEYRISAYSLTVTNSNIYSLTIANSISTCVVALEILPVIPGLDIWL